MNTIWSDFVQSKETLYYTRKLRFDDRFAPQFTQLFDLNREAPLKILEIGCGPGALAGALHRWYPNAEITAIDRDSAFIAFAREHEPGIRFEEGDATALPFADNTFDVTISHTVSEHVEPAAFFGEQHRVLNSGGVCLVLSVRKGIGIRPAVCAKDTPFEKQFWEKVERYDDSMERYSICKYPLSEAELPQTMEKHGFSAITTGYTAIDLTPDDPKYPPGFARAIIEANRHVALNPVEYILRFAPEHFTREEAEEMKRLIHTKYDQRVKQYVLGEKQWDTYVSFTLIVRGIKA